LNTRKTTKSEQQKARPGQKPEIRKAETHPKHVRVAGVGSAEGDPRCRSGRSGTPLGSDPRE
jgi:hypothetical protein